MKKVSLQIQSVLYHNEKEALIKALEALKRALEIEKTKENQIEKCIIKYGDASKEPIFSEDEIENLRKEIGMQMEIQYTFFNENTGTAKGHNRLAKHCGLDYMMIMNPDVLVSSRFFVEMLKPFKDPKVGLVEARQTPIEHPKEYNMKTFETGWSTTACVIFPLVIFNKIKGFDEKSFFMYCDDVDFSWRIRLEGYKLYYQPLAVVYHAKRLSSSGGWQPTAAERYYSAEAALMMAHKWSNPQLLSKLLHDFKRSKNEELIKAVSVFNDMKKSKRLVEPIDREHKVSTFIEGGYSKHRFVL